MEDIMTLDEKLELFYNAAMENATNQNIQIIDEYKKSLQVIYDDYKKEALRKAEINLKSESENLVREKNRTLSNESLKLKRTVSEKSAELTDKLFEDVKRKLYDYMKTSNYFDLLCSQIKHAKDFALGDEITLYINPSDENLKTSLESNTGVNLTISARDFIGGTRAVIHSKNILIDNSFFTKLEDLKNSFTL
jgi:V/A-type H+/Na+-transporting ATPase subunit E